ncbi:MAG: PAS domain S-box protein [Cyclobacteriaceae bacterium]
MGNVNEIGGNNKDTERKQGIFGLQTLKSFLMLIAAVVALVIIVSNVVSYLLNEKQLEVSKRVNELTMPVSLEAQNILIGLNQASTAQRGFLLTGEQGFTMERKQVWEEQIWPALEVLKKTKAHLTIEENRLRISRLEELLPKYEELQKEIDTFRKSYSTDLDTEIDIADSSVLHFVDMVKQNQANNQKIESLIAEKVLPLRNEIRAEIDPLVKTQKEFLRSDMVQMVKSVEQSSNFVILLSLIGLIITFVLVYLFLKRLEKAINKPTVLLSQLSEGKLADQVDETRDEMNRVIKAARQLNENLAAASQFARQIGEGNFNSDFKPAGEEDTLGNALVHMRDRLQMVAEEDKRRNWVTTGLAQMGDILRKENSSASELYLNIVRFIIKYLNANQGGLFLLQDTEGAEPCLELVACYAYERQKFINKQLMIGEGLIGQAFVEKDTILLTEVPQNYVSITSGLGDANPRCILIVPLKVNEEVSGVLELASFKILEDYQVEFVEKLAESVASTISSVKIAHRTSQLLEETRQQAEEMRAQEEEMRQNMEELQATQEEMQRKSTEAEAQNARLDAILSSTVDAILTINDRGIIETVNPACEKLFGYSRTELIGNNVSMLMTSEHSGQHDSYLGNYSKTGHKKIIGKSREVMAKRKDGSNFYLSLAVNEIEVAGKRIFTGILRDISEQKYLQQELQKRLEEARSAEEELRQNMEELSAIQESLAAKNNEIEEVRRIEKERANQQIASRNKMMEKAMEKFKQKEKELNELLQQKDAQIQQLSK